MIATNLPPTPTACKRNYSILYSIKKGYFNHIRFLLENNLANPNETTQTNYNPVTQVNKVLFLPRLNVQTQSKSCMSFASNDLLSLKTTSNGRTPLMLCTFIEDEGWSHSLAQNLIEKGAIVGQKDMNGLNALMYACLNQKEDLVRLYSNALGDYNLNAADVFGNTVMHMASLGQNESICFCLKKMCFKYGVNLKKLKNKLGHTPHDLCIIRGHKDCTPHVKVSTYTATTPNMSPTKKPSNTYKSELYSIKSDSPTTDAHKTNADNFNSPTLTSVGFKTVHSLKEKPFVSPRQEKDPALAILDFYKQLYTFKEKPIKTNLIFDFTNDQQPLFKKLPMAFEQQQQPPQQTQSVKNPSTVIQKCVSSNGLASPNKLRTGTKKTWRAQIFQMFDDLESQHTDSYRRGHTNGITYEQMGAINRRMSLNRKSLHSLGPAVVSTSRKASLTNQKLPQTNKLSLLT